MLKFLIILLYIFLFLLLFIPVKAVDLTVDCNKDQCSVDSSTLLFSSDNWYPGRSISRIARINNDSELVQRISSSLDKLTGNQDLKNKLILSIKTLESKPIWSGSIDNFEDQQIEIAKLQPISFIDLLYEIKLDKSAGNNIQNKKISFDLILDFSNEAIKLSPTIKKQMPTRIIKKFGEVLPEDIELTVKGSVKGENVTKIEFSFWIMLISGQLILIAFYAYMKSKSKKKKNSE